MLKLKDIKKYMRRKKIKRYTRQDEDKKTSDCYAILDKVKVRFILDLPGWLRNTIPSQFRTGGEHV